MRKLARFAAFETLLIAAACSVNPSRAPLGGSYELPESAKATDRRAPEAAKPSATAEISEPEAGKTVALVAPPAAADAGAPAVATNTDLIRYDPFKPGDQLKSEVTLSVSAEIRGGPPGMLSNSNITMDAKLLVEMRIRRTSAQSLDELELTVTTQSMHTEFAGRSSDSKQEPAETYDVTLSGQSPTIRPRSGAKPDDGERAILLALVSPIAEYHAHWARSPTLELKPGWTSKVPVSVPAFAGGGNDTVHVGPFGAHYTGRNLGADSVPFEVTLPIQYGMDMGKLEFNLAGTANVSAAKGRPISIELSGPLTAHGGPSGSQMSFTGTAKFGATLSYH